MIRVVRRLLGVKAPSIDRETAMAIARQECERRGLSWREPVRVTEKLRSYEFWTNARSRGANVRIVVDAADGSILAFNQIRY